MAAFAFGGTVVPQPAGALDQEGFTVSREQPKSTRDYQPIVGNNTAGADAPEFGPDGCGTGGALGAACDAIPIEIVRPPEYDDYTPWEVRVTLEWESQQVTDDSVQETQTNDMDLWLYFKSGEQLSSDGATGGNPEISQFVSPSSDTYYVIINNYAGVNTGYTLTVEFVPEEILPQVTEEDFARPRQPKAPAPPRTTTTTAAPSTTTTVGNDDDDDELTAVVVGNDDDFTNIGLTPDDVSESGLLDAGDPLAVRDSDDAPPASGVALVAWLVAVPVLVLGVGWWLLRRRAPTGIVPG